MAPAGRERFSWAFAATVGPGLFVGSCWLLVGFMALLGTAAPWWLRLVNLAPGAAVVGLVLGARRHPLPYGAALAALGALPLVLYLPRRDFLLPLLFGLPLIGVGLGFILARRRLRPPETVHPPEP